MYMYVTHIHAIRCACRFAGVLASDQSDNEFLEPTELEGRKNALEKLEEEKRSYQEQLAR